MRKNKQLVVDPKKGDCMRACITSMLGIPNDPALPNIDDADWYWKWIKFLGRFGLKLQYEQKACWKEGYWMASVKSKNFPGGWHAIVMKSHNVVFDPSTKKRYKTGESLLSSDVVRGGHFFEVTDASKLHKLEKYRHENL